MKKLAALLAPALIAGCTTPIMPPIQPIPVPIPQPYGLTRFPDDVVQYFRFHSGLDAPANLVVSQQAEWAALWAQIVRRHGNPPPAPYVDFSREMLLVTAMGTQPTGGFGITIENVIERPDTIDVYVVRNLLGPGCGATAALTHPADVVRVPASQKPVRWYVRDQATPCG